MPFSSAGAPSASMTIRSVVSGLRCTKPTNESMIAVKKFIPVSIYIPAKTARAESGGKADDAEAQPVLTKFIFAKVGKIMRISIKCRKFGDCKRKQITIRYVNPPYSHFARRRALP